MHSSDGEQGSGEIDCGSKAGVGFVVSSGDATEFFDPLEEVFDQVSPLVHLDVMRNGRLARSFNTARKALLSKALSAMRAWKSTPVMSGSTPMLSPPGRTAKA